MRDGRIQWPGRKQRRLAGRALAVAEQARADEHRVLARGGLGPQQAGAGERLVERVALGMERPERVAVAGQGALRAVVSVVHALPGELHVDFQQRDQVLGQRVAYPAREHAAAPERDHLAWAGVIQHPAHDLLLGRPERRLAVELELAGDRVPEALTQHGVAVDGLCAA
jgi:hypothetical protein